MSEDLEDNTLDQGVELIYILGRIKIKNILKGPVATECIYKTNRLLNY